LPTGVIAAAQQAAAATFGAHHTWLLVNGCSAGIHAAVMATTRPGQALLLARNCHLSAFAACVLAGCQPVWLQPEADALHGVAHCVTPQELAAGFAAARQQGLAVAAVLVVSPTYYGAVAHVQGESSGCTQHRASGVHACWALPGPQAMTKTCCAWSSSLYKPAAWQVDIA
jgi:arginine/lysine/ornithine decarboxylase